MAMNPNAKMLWVEALRSGKYQQTTGKLRKVTDLQGQYGYCCLGVLCEVAAENGVVVEEGVLAFHNFPSQEVMDWAGLDVPDPALTNQFGTATSASVWNDEKHASFAEIADLIERSL